MCSCVFIGAALQHTGAVLFLWSELAGHWHETVIASIDAHKGLNYNN